ncbi:hypothetical protein [Streptomyces sp. NPDC127072]|uniref:hypothetical protein n=1 Tax=Streptomyces sp. NPDC127072 TaxID=3347129 RepID=UPI00365C1347
MRIRTTTAAIVAVLAVAVVGCSGDEGGDGKADTAKDAGIPPEPTGAERDALLAAVMDVSGNLIHDEDKAVDAARNQCAALDGGAANPDRIAAQRFSYDGVTLSDDDGKHINLALRRTLCPGS